MNRLAIATHVTAKLNVPSLLGQCGNFVQREYEMIYDKHNWRDVEYTYTATLTAGANLIALDSRISRVASVMADGQLLDPINAVLGMQYDPTLFTRTGAPEVYEEIYKPSTAQASGASTSGPIVQGGPDPTVTEAAGGANYIKVYPIPAQDVRLVVVGIRKISQLSSDDSVSDIRNIDNCLIAFTEADLLERVKQYGMANAKRQEAVQMLTDAIALDTAERSNFVRSIKPMSVSGGTLTEMVDAVCARAKNWAPENRVLIKEIIRRNWLDLYDMTLWREAQMLRLMSVSGGSIVTLPVEFDSVISVLQNDKFAAMLPADMNYFFNLDPSVFDATNTGTPSHYVLISPVATPVQPPTASNIQINSTSDNDKSYVFFKGELDGTEQSETVQLNGTAFVSTVHLYDTILIEGKEITAGDVSTYYSVPSAGTQEFLLGTIPASERSRSHIRLQLFRNAGQDLTILVHGKRKVIPLVHDHDKPILRGIGQALVYMTLAEVMPLLGGDGAAYGAKAEAAVKTLMNREVQQSSHKTRIVPIVDAPYASRW